MGRANAEEREEERLSSALPADGYGVVGGQGDMTRSIVIIIIMLGDDGERHGYGKADEQGKQII